MNISDLTYLEIATEANKLEGGIQLYQVGTGFYQHFQGVAGGSTSGPGGTGLGASVWENTIATWGGLTILF